MTKKYVMEWLLSHVNHKGDECLIWPFARASNGYAKMGWDGKTCTATRVMCEIKDGPPPSDIHEAAHSCGKGHLGCIHPEHLRWATPVENAKDREITERHNRGTNNPASKLTEDDVVSIRYLCEAGVKQRQVARMFGIAFETVFGIYRSGRWPHVTRNHTVIERVSAQSVSP